MSFNRFWTTRSLKRYRVNNLGTVLVAKTAEGQRQPRAALSDEVKDSSPTRKQSTGPDDTDHGERLDDDRGQTGKEDGSDELERDEKKKELTIEDSPEDQLSS